MQIINRCFLMKVPKRHKHDWSWFCEITNGIEDQIWEVYQCNACHLYKVEISFDNGTKKIIFRKTNPMADFFLIGYEYREYFVVKRLKSHKIKNPEKNGV